MAKQKIEMQELPAGVFTFEEIGQLIMHDIDPIWILLFLISCVFLTLAIKSKNSYTMSGAVMYSFAALPLIFAVGA